VFDRIDATAVIALLASFAAVTTPAWEAPDEPDHAQNAQTLASGHWYRMERGAGQKARQAPLYYLVGWRIGRPLIVLIAIVAAALSAMWIASLSTDTYEGRLAFIGLPAVACLAALG
jgi:hypothetical protein